MNIFRLMHFILSFQHVEYIEQIDFMSERNGELSYHLNIHMQSGNTIYVGSRANAAELLSTYYDWAKTVGEAVQVAN